jgi:WD40 repeat protein
MGSKFFFKHVFFSACLLSLSLSACGPVQADIVSTAAPIPQPAESISPEAPPPSVPALPMDAVEVVFVTNGSVQVWDEASQQTKTIVNTGDVFSVTASDDGQVIALTRGSWVGDLDGYEQFALWAVDRDGGNLRELISAQELRLRINPGERESSNFFQFSWVPQSHHLLVSGTKYIVQAEGLSHAVPQGAYLVDADTGSVTVLAGAAENVRIVPSPDGKQIALMSPTRVGFIHADGSNRREDVLVYAKVGLTAHQFPAGVWTRDSHAFVATGSLQRDPGYEVNFTIWRIPADGSSLEALADISESNPSSVNFSPDGKNISFYQTSGQQSAEIVGWFIKPLLPEAGPLALPTYGKETFSANLHWSPAGDAYVIKDQDLLRLCPNAAQDSQVCGEPVRLGSGIITALQWVDASRFLFETIEPYALSLGKLDGTITPIVTWEEGQRWSENDVISGWSFYFPQ